MKPPYATSRSAAESPADHAARRSLRALLLLAAIGCTVQTVEDDVAVPQHELPAPVAQLSEPFSVVTSVRELSDGRVLVSDEKDVRLVVADFRTDRTTVVGGRGRGPSEYTHVARIWALGGDSSAMKLPFEPRTLILFGDRVVSTLGFGDNATGAFGSSRIQGANRHSGVLGFQFVRTDTDSLLVVRAARGTSRVDTIGRALSTEAWVTRNAPAAVAEEAAGDPSSGRGKYAVAVSGPDQVAMFPDGWIVIARTSPYRVDWCSPDLACRAGNPLPFTQRPLTERDKATYLANVARAGTWPPTTDVSETSGWPTRFPPFAAPTYAIDASALTALPNGTLLIERLPDADESRLPYDVVDRAGSLVARWHVSFGQRIIGASATYIYVITTNEDGTQRLSRHPWP